MLVVIEVLKGICCEPAEFYGTVDGRIPAPTINTYNIIINKYIIYMNYKNVCLRDFEGL